MLTGLDILIARMKTNPEEFLVDRFLREGEMLGGKWNDLINYAGRVANEEERQALEDAIKELHRDDFNERVFKRLAGEEQEQEESPMQKFRIKTPAQNVAQALTHQQMMQNSVLISNQGVIQGGQYDPNTHGYATLTGGFQAAETKQEGAPIPISGGGTGLLGLRNFFGR